MSPSLDNPTSSNNENNEGGDDEDSGDDDGHDNGHNPHGGATNDAKITPLVPMGRNLPKTHHSQIPKTTLHSKTLTSPPKLTRR